MRSILHEYRPALIFLVVFIGLYLVLNTVYGLFITSFLPGADSVTKVVTQQVAYVLSFFHEEISVMPDDTSRFIPILLSGTVIVNVFEGCNGINVMIVYLSFLIAFRGTWKNTLYVGFGGIVIIYIMNLLRVGLLFEVALNFPNQLYFFHKFLFTGFIYAVVFVIWYYWIRHVRRSYSTEA